VNIGRKELYVSNKYNATVNLHNLATFWNTLKVWRLNDLMIMADFLLNMVTAEFGRNTPSRYF